MLHKVSVCLTVFNEEDAIEELLQSLFNQTRKPVIRDDPKTGIPEYSYGTPLYGEDNVTYLIFNKENGYIKTEKK